MAAPSPNLLAKLDAMAAEFDQIEHKLNDPDVLTDHQQVRSLSVKRAALVGLVERYQRYRATTRQAAEHRQIVAENADAELVDLARQELPQLDRDGAALLDEIAAELVTAADRSIGSVIFELRAGTGGAEAALWAGDLLEMYQRFATRKGWEVTLMDLTPGDAGGIRNAILNIQGAGVWQQLGYESGVHCVKRVPATETQGRIHTSTATVAVLPEPEKAQIDIPDSDVKMDITTAQGPGGQNVNKVATAVHLIHIPTGIEVRMQESKSQQQNRTRAWQLLRARVYDHHQKQLDAQRSQARSRMIGSGERSERIRTYRYKESIVVDHRLEQQPFPLQGLLDGAMEPLVHALIEQDRAERLAAL
ncbi:MAG: PCRF domain-containing protein [Planctomycetota bacterium]|nr:PCRF domain-containing protein [Planctomycetota bacterium]